MRAIDELELAEIDVAGQLATAHESLPPDDSPVHHTQLTDNATAVLHSQE